MGAGLSILALALLPIMATVGFIWLIKPDFFSDDAAIENVSRESNWSTARVAWRRGERSEPLRSDYGLRPW